MRSIHDPANDPLALLADAAASNGPPPIERPRLERMVEVAILTSGARRRRRQRVAWLAAMAAAIALISGASWLFLQVPDANGPPLASPTPVSLPTHLQLPSGDRISRLGEGELEVLALRDATRSLRLSQGDALFDVAQLGADGSFTLVTPHLRVRVIGTIFAVGVVNDVSRVQVFEGVVEVLDAGRIRRLEAGMTYDSETRGEAEWESPLAALGRAAAARREVELPSAVEPVGGSGPTGREGEPATGREGEPATGREGEPATGNAERAVSSEVAPLVSLEVARRWLADAEVERALQTARRARRERPRDAAWATFLGDALRASGEHGPAADAYDRAASLSSPSRATQAGYLAARVRLGELSDPEGALRSLEASRAAAAGSPIEERATVLTARAQLAAGRRSEARATAERYLLRFPGGSEREWMAQLER